METNERVGQAGNEGREEKKGVLSEGGQAKVFPLCAGHTILRGELAFQCGRGMLARSWMTSQPSCLWPKITSSS